MALALNPPISRSPCLSRAISHFRSPSRPRQCHFSSPHQRTSLRRNPLAGSVSGSPSPLAPIRADEATVTSSSGNGDAIDGISRREAVLQVWASGVAVWLAGELPCAADAVSPESRPKFYSLEGSGGVKALDIREGTGATPQLGDKVAIHYYARLAAKQGWRFDSSYDHIDPSGAPEPYVFVVGDGTVIAGLDTAVRTMKEGGVRRVVIPPSQGYQNTTQGPIPPNFSDRQRLYTTIFNPTRLANGEGSTLGILVFDIELLRIRPA